MTETRLKRAVGMFVVACHIFTAFLAIVIFFAAGFTYDQLTTTLAIVLPMFAAHVTQIILFFTENRYAAPDTSQRVAGEFIVLSFLFPALIAVLVWFSVGAQATGHVFDNFEQFKMSLVLFEGIFAAYSARLMTSLFGRPSSR